MPKERQRQMLHRNYKGTTQELLDTKPTPQTARMPVRVDMERLDMESLDMERLYIEMFHVEIADHMHPGCFWCRFGIQELLRSPYRVPV